jgi:hypothetical protein
VLGEKARHAQYLARNNTQQSVLVVCFSIFPACNHHHHHLLQQRQLPLA